MKAFYKYFIILFLISITSYQAQIEKAEFFIDTDPGEGNGTEVQLPDNLYGNFYEEILREMNTNDLSKGIHTVYLRYKNKNGIWSNTASTVFNIAAPTGDPKIPVIKKLTFAEYFIDVDPGQGNAQPVIALDGNLNETFEEIISQFDANNFSKGIHTLYVRLNDNDNWGKTYGALFNISEAIGDPILETKPTITNAEFFVDTDPGVGDGNQLLAFDGSYEETFEEVINLLNSNNYENGLHTLFIRVKDEDNWSKTYGALFNVTSSIGDPELKTKPVLTQGEYFIDEDPGEGNGYILNSLDGNYNELFENIYSNHEFETVEEPVHTLWIRLRDGSGDWSKPYGTILAYEAVESEITVKSDWNLVSIPLKATNMESEAVFPAATSNIFGFNNGYISMDSLENEKGYWVKFDNPDTIEIAGRSVNDSSIAYTEGWNLIGPFEETITVNEIVDDPASSIVSEYFGFEDGYFMADSLFPGKGYWMKASESGSLSYGNVNKVSVDNEFSQAEAEIPIWVSDGVDGNDTLIVGQDPGGTDEIDAALGEYELPPMPPTGVFDARLVLPNDLTSPVDIREGGTTFETGTVYTVMWQLGSGSEGFTLEWFLPGTISMTMQDAITGTIVNESFGPGVGSYTITENINEVEIYFEGIVPVELSSFTSNATSESIQLEWTTASEKNNSGFEVQRSEDNENFAKVGFVDGHGTTTEKQEYSFTDNSVQNGTYYYRLKQVDLDGSYEYSDVVEVDMAVPKEFSLEQNYPNPFNPTTTIKFGLPVEAEVNIILHNVLGQKVDDVINGKLSAGVHTYNFNANRLPSGIYFYTIQAKGIDGTDFFATKKMMLMR